MHTAHRVPKTPPSALRWATYGALFWLAGALVMGPGRVAAGTDSSAAPPEEAPLSALPYSPSLDLPSMDPTVQPCEDFYQHVCGGWIKNNPVPPDQAAWGVYHRLENENTRYLWGLLKEAAAGGSERDPSVQKIGDHFAACMDEPGIERLGASPLDAILRTVDGLRTPCELAAYLGEQHLSLVSNQMLFGFGAAQDPRDSSRYIPFAIAGGLGLPDRDYYVRDDADAVSMRKRYVAHIQRMLVLSGSPAGTAVKAAEDILTFETSLAKASLTRVEQRDPHRLYNKMSLASFQEVTPAFPWKCYLKGAGLPTYPELNVTEPQFFKQLNQEVAKGRMATVRAYLRWQVVHHWAPVLSSDFVQEDFAFFRKELRGIGSIAPRWKRCVQAVDRDLGEALGEVFVKRAVSPEVKTVTSKMTREIQAAMEEEIKNLTWMGPETKRKAMEKLHSMVNKIGWPDTWRDYSAVAITPGDHFGNVRRATVFESRRVLDRIGKPIDRGEWHMTPPTVNAYYDAQMNDMNFPAGVLQPPLLDLKMDDAPNYGNTGATIGHELTHGFDDEGRNFDAQGNLKDWWAPEDARAFEERAACVAEQFSSYVIVDDIRINGRLTLGEDVADLGGTLLAYNAWKRATAGQDLKSIDGFTPDQRFFIGMGQWACNNTRVEESRVRAVTDPHSPPRYRVNGLVANMPEFARAFSCRPGQPMVNPKPCKVW